MADKRWAPAAKLEVLRERARLTQTIRAFFAARGVLEVETPSLSRAAATDPHLHSLETRISGAEPWYLHTSPEFPMKRLLAAGSGDIWQCSRVFRSGEAGRRHNPEFTLLEWYRIGFTLADLMAEVAEFVRAAGLVAPTIQHYSYAGAFERHLGVDPFAAGREDLCRVAADNAIEAADLTREQWLDLLFAEGVARRFPVGTLVFVRAFPASQAALARLSPGNPATAERFECFFGPLELANGYHELTDPVEQRRRFEGDNRRRRASGLPEMPVDENLLAALDAGMPDCCGVALGVDRLLMALTGSDHIHDVLAFPNDRA